MGWGQCLLVERLSAAGKFLPVAVAVPEDYLAVYISECGAVALLKVVRQLVAGGKEPMVTTAPCLRARHVIRGIVPALPIAVEGNHAVCRGVQQGASARKYDRTLTSGRQAGRAGRRTGRASRPAGNQTLLIIVHVEAWRCCCLCSWHCQEHTPMDAVQQAVQRLKLGLLAKELARLHGTHTKAPHGCEC